MTEATAGQPRTGTRNLRRVPCATPQARSKRYLRMMNPVPTADAAPRDPRGRIAELAGSLRLARAASCHRNGAMLTVDAGHPIPLA